MKREGDDKERLEVNVGRSVRVPVCMVSIDFTSWYGRHPFSSSCSVPHVICKCCTQVMLCGQNSLVQINLSLVSVLPKPNFVL